MKNSKRFQVNDYITLKLVKGETVIFIDNKRFRTCKALFLNIYKNQTHKYEAIESVDKIIQFRHFSSSDDISPEEEFWGHCSNLQAWAENDYDTRLLESKLAFPLLKRLTDVGDSKAKKVFKEEIAYRFESKYIPVVKFLSKEGYLNYLSEEEIKVVINNIDSKKLLNNDIFQKLSYFEFYPLLKELSERGIESASKLLKKSIKKAFIKKKEREINYLVRNQYLKTLSEKELERISKILEKRIIGIFRDKEVDQINWLFKKDYLQYLQENKLKEIFENWREFLPLLLEDSNKVKKIISGINGDFKKKTKVYKNVLLKWLFDFSSPFKMRLVEFIIKTEFLSGDQNQEKWAKLLLTRINKNHKWVNQPSRKINHISNLIIEALKSFTEKTEDNLNLLLNKLSEVINDKTKEWIRDTIIDNYLTGECNLKWIKTVYNKRPHFFNLYIKCIDKCMNRKPLNGFAFDVLLDLLYQHRARNETKIKKKIEIIDTIIKENPPERDQILARVIRKDQSSKIRNYIFKKIENGSIKDSGKLKKEFKEKISTLYGVAKNESIAIFKIDMLTKDKRIKRGYKEDYLSYSTKNKHISRLNLSSSKIEKIPKEILKFKKLNRLKVSDNVQKQQNPILSVLKSRGVKIIFGELSIPLQNIDDSLRKVLLLEINKLKKKHKDFSFEIKYESKNKLAILQPFNRNKRLRNKAYRYDEKKDKWVLF